MLSTSGIAAKSMPSENHVKTTVSKVPHVKILWKIKRFRRLFLVILYAWLFMNVDPIYSRRTLVTMMASRLINRSISNLFNGGEARRNNGNNGMSTAETIALILALNNANSNRLLPMQTSLVTRQQSDSLYSPYERQLALPAPDPTSRMLTPTPFIVFITALIAFFSAVISGFSPFFAVFAAIIISFIAAVIAFILIFIKVEKKSDKGDKGSKGGKGKGAPMIKKLVIKKTVLPFIIPIPYKKKEKEVVYKYKYKYIPKPILVEYEKKMDQKEYKSDNSVELYKEDRLKPLKKLERLMSEQDRLQNLVDNAVSGKLKDRRGALSRLGDND